MRDPDTSHRLPRPYPLAETVENRDQLEPFFRHLPPAMTSRFSYARNAVTAMLGSLAMRRNSDRAAMEGRIRAEQIDVAMRLAPLGALCYLSVVLVVAVALWNSASHGYLIPLSLVVVALTAVALTACWRWRLNGKPPECSARHVYVLIVVSFAYGLCLASIPAVLFVGANSDLRLLIACTTAGLIAVTLSVSAVPIAAIATSSSIITGAFFALASTGQKFYIFIAVLLLLYSLFIFLTTFQLGGILLARIVSEIKVERQKNVISFLLNEFEDGASDWIWEADREGRIRNPSARFCQLVGKTAGELEGMRLSQLLEPQLSGSSPVGERETLWKVMENGATFRNSLVCVNLPDDVRYWSLSGKPLMDPDGQLFGYRGVGSDVTAEKKAEERLARQACYDGLTDLPNRHLFYDCLNEARERESASGATFSVLCLDLDEFKSVNDAFGHAIGDQLLRIVAGRLQTCLESGDMAARLSGDEFAILTRGTGRDHTRKAAERIIGAIAEPMVIEGVRLGLHVSIGIAFSPCTNPAEIMRHADLALYRAKNEGRNCYRYYEAEMDTEVEARRALASDLRGAQARGEFALHYQPLVCAKGLETIGFEALMRWRHPIHGLVPPSKFIPIAEENGSIVEIGEWVIREACRAAVGWPGEIGVAVNLSPVQLRYSDVVRIIKNALDESGLAPKRLEVEITESALLDANPKTIRALNRLLRMGVRLALDDFGTGYSSLGYLRKLRFNKIKIDQSFVRDLPNEPGSLAIVRAVIGLGRSFGMKVTAEGVETSQQLNCLRREGCDVLQGYLFSPPKPEELLPEMLDFRDRQIDSSVRKRAPLQVING
jgi:diguanylate cyclase (GGDEF)-like protein/PAS domain S-box-containing protein